MPNDFSQRAKDDAAEDDFFATQLRAGTISMDTVDGLKNIEAAKVSVPVTDLNDPASQSAANIPEQIERLATVRYVDD